MKEWTIPYNRYLAWGSLTFGLLYWLLYLFLHQEFRLMDTVIPIITISTGALIFTRNVLHFQDGFFYHQAIIGPNKRKYKWEGFHQFSILDNRLFLVKDEQHRIFITNLWNVGPQNWKALQEKIQQTQTLKDEFSS